MEFTFSELCYLFSASFAVVSFLTPLMRSVAIKFGIVDSPNASHKTHKNPVPYLGGIAIVAGILFVTYGAILYRGYNSDNFWLATSVLVPAFLMSAVGLVDDLRNLSPWPRFIAQNIVAIASVAILVSTKTLGSPTGSTLADVLITVTWIVGITNSINFLDNIDGGASGVVAISSFFIFLVAYQSGQFLVSSFALALTGATLGFLVWNRPPARIFMGDAGALFLGILLASLTVRLRPNPINEYARFFVPFCLVAIPILDTSSVVFSRIKSGTSPFKGGRDHLSHRLMSLGLDRKQAMFSLWIAAFFFGCIALLISNSPFKFEGLLSSIAALTWLAMAIFFYRISKAKKR